MPEIVSVKIIDHSKETIERLNDKIDLALVAAGEVVEGYAKTNCPVDTGLLRNSITHARYGQGPAVMSYASDDGSESGSYAGIMPDTGEKSEYIGTNVSYAMAVEYKDSVEHKNGRAHFLRDGMQDHISEIKNKIMIILSS